MKFLKWFFLIQSFFLMGCGQFLPALQNSTAIRGESFTYNGVYKCENTAKRGEAENKMRRLITSEIINTHEDLLGTIVTTDPDVQAYYGLLASDIISGSVNDLPDSPSDSHAQAMIEFANRAVELIYQNTAARTRVFGTCAGANAVDDNCARSFIANFGPKVFRRPVTAEESSMLFAYFTETGGVEGIKRIFMRLILAPEMTFHIEKGTQIIGNRIRLNDYEVASRLSYRLIGTTPDDQLMAAAQQGQLGTLDGVLTQAKRLMASHPKGKKKLDEFFRYYLQTDKYDEPFAPAGLLNGISTTGLKEEYAAETHDFVDHVVWTKQGSFNDLLTSKDVFPRTARMARILGVGNNAPTTTPVQTNEAYAGIVLRPGNFSSARARTTAFHRSLFVRRRILCEVFGPPDANAVANREDEVGDISQLPNRDRLTILTDVPQCMGCHSLVNPVGFALEGYDQIGMQRSVESIFNMNNQVVAEENIDTFVTNPFIRNADGWVDSLSSAHDLAQYIYEGKEARACFVKTIFEFQRWREKSESDNCTLTETEKLARDSDSVLDIYIKSVANDDIFWKATTGGNGVL